MKRTFAIRCAAILAAGSVLGLTGCGTSPDDLSGVKALDDGLAGCPWADSDSSEDARGLQAQENGATGNHRNDDDDARKCAAARAKALGYSVLSDKQASEFGLPMTTVTYVGEMEFRPLYVSASEEPRPECTLPAVIATDHGDFSVMIDYSLQPDSDEEGVSWAPMHGFDRPAELIQDLYFNGLCGARS